MTFVEIFSSVILFAENATFNLNLTRSNMTKIIFFLVHFANLAFADDETCSIVADCNAKIEARLSALESKNGDLESQNEELVAKLENLEGKNGELVAKIDNMEVKNIQLESEVGQLKADVVELEEMVLPGKIPASVENRKIIS